MSKPRLVLIGNGMAGVRTVEELLKIKPDHYDITIFGAEPHPNYNRILLSPVLAGEMTIQEIVLNELAWYKENNIKLHTGKQIKTIDRVKRKVIADDGTEESYDRLLIATGSTPFMLPIPGNDLPGVIGYRDIKDTDEMIDAAARHKHAVVIGGGFIGVEVAENFVHRGLRLALVEATDQVMAPMDPEMVAPVHTALRSAGVDLRLGQSVASIGADDVTLADGTRVAADVVVAAIGVRPDTSLAVGAGLAVGERGGIRVDDQFRTSDPDVYAIGDAVEKVDAIDDSASLVPLAQTANLQGRRVADIIMGRPAYGRPVLGTAIVGVFGLQVASTGWNEKRLRQAGRPYRAIHTHPGNHAGYYPGSCQLSLKLLVDPETDEILGAQGVGESGVDKRIDVIATAITGGILASELADLELAYAPQFGSAKDPVNMLGHIAANLRDGLTETIQWHEVDAAVAAGATVLDVRTQSEHDANAIPGSMLIPLDDLRDRLDEVPAGDLVVHCAVGLRGYLATRVLEQHRNGQGWGRIRNLDGGMKTWLAGTGA